jgi:hypothetical protein
MKRCIAGAVLMACTGAALFAAGVTSGSVAASTAGAKKFTVYSIAVQKQFVNNQDDRARGKGNNPFGNFASPFVTPPNEELDNGPFIGDEALLTYNLYAGRNLKARVGTAAFVCQYNFNQNGFCDVVFSLNGGTLVAAGVFDFRTPKFDLTVSGGTDSHRGVKGHVLVSVALPTEKRTIVVPSICQCPGLEGQRLDFTIHPA